MLQDNEMRALREYVQKLTIVRSDGGTYIDHFSDLPEFSKVILTEGRLGKCISPGELSSIIARTIWEVDNSLQNESKGSIETLSDEHVNALIQSISSVIASYPRPYYFYFHLPKFIPTGIHKIAIGSDISLVEYDHNLETSAQKNGETKNATLSESERQQYGTLRPGRVYVQISVDGYVGSSFDSATASNALSRFKHFLYLSMVYSVLKQQDFWFPHLLNWEIAALPVVIQHCNPLQDDRHEIPLPPGIDQYVSTLGLNTDKTQIYERGAPFQVGTMRKPHNLEELAAQIPGAFRDVINCLELFRDDADCEPIKSAIEWFIDADTSYNDTISFLQSCIGLEALLGDENPDRLSERLSDRYAYLHGKTSSQ